MEGDHMKGKKLVERRYCSDTIKKFSVLWEGGILGEE